MTANIKQYEILEQPAYVTSWSVANVDGFIPAVLNRYVRNFGCLPTNFSLVTCPQIEVNAIGGLPFKVRELTDSRTRIQHFTSCNKLYLVILLFGENAESRRHDIQQLLSWSEGYKVAIEAGITQLVFAEAIEEIDDVNAA